MPSSSSTACRAIDGFYGASSMERLPTEIAIAQQVRDFVGLKLRVRRLGQSRVSRAAVREDRRARDCMLGDASLSSYLIRADRGRPSDASSCQGTFKAVSTQ